MEAASSECFGIQQSPEALFLHAARICIFLSFFFFFCNLFHISGIHRFLCVLRQATIGTNGKPSNRTVVFRFGSPICIVSLTYSQFRFMEIHDMGCFGFQGIPRQH